MSRMGNNLRNMNAVDEIEILGRSSETEKQEEKVTKCLLTVVGVFLGGIVSGCATVDSFASPFAKYQGIENRNNISVDSLRVIGRAYAVKYGMTEIGESSVGIMFENAYCVSGGTPGRCKMNLFQKEGRIEFNLVQCSEYRSSKTGWAPLAEGMNNGERQAVLNDIYYKFIDPQHPQASEVLGKTRLGLTEKGEADLFIGKMKFLNQ